MIASPFYFQDYFSPSACPECRILSVNIVHLINYLFF